MTESYYNPKETGLRFKSARSLVPLSRKDFCDKHNLNRFTVQSWEIGRNYSRGKNLTAFCDALAKEGVFCTVEWLLEGVGAMPVKLQTRKTLELLKVKRTREPERKRISEEEARIQAEVKFFLGHQPKGVQMIVTQVADNLMEPYYSEGDFVGGVLLEGRSIQKLVGKLCLIALEKDSFIVRRLRTEGNRYLLVPENPMAPVTGIRNLVAAAEIIWHRRPSSTVAVL